MSKTKHRPAAQDRAGAESGFSLIELLVVIVIISILAAIAIPVFFAQRDKALRSQVVSALRNGATIMEAWSTQNNGDYTLPPAAGSTPEQEMDWMKGDGWPPTEGVLVDVVGADQDGFCLHGTHETIDSINLEMDSAGGAPVEGDCT